MIDNRLCDDSDLDREVKSLFIRTNIILRRFAKCTRLFKPRVFKSYCLCFYDISLWTNFSVASHKKFRSCYYKCIKRFFVVILLFYLLMYFLHILMLPLSWWNKVIYKYASVTQMLFELGLPNCDTVLFNAKVRLTDSYSRCHNNVVHAFGS